MSSSSYPIRALLKNSESQLGKLVSQASAIHELNHTINGVIDPELRPYCRVGCYQKGVLTLFSDNAGCATRLRYQVPHLLSKLRTIKQWAGLISIQVKVQAYWIQKSLEAPLPTYPIALPFICAKALQTLADTFKSELGGQNLASSLERLAKHGVRSTAIPDLN